MSFLEPTHLNTVCTPVEKGEFIGDILAKMRIAINQGQDPGCGLAANQVGETKRIILVQTENFNHFIINPVITKKFGGTHTSKEGCLSFPGKLALVTRHNKIEVTGFSEDWQPLKFKLKQFKATIIQHEVDHLNGISCVDKAFKVYAK